VKALNIPDLMCFKDIAPVLLEGFCTVESPIIYGQKDSPDTMAVVLDGPAAQDPERLNGLLEFLEFYGRQQLNHKFRIYNVSQNLKG